MTNPQGFGADTLGKMQTVGGQSVAGAVGGADESARLAASRTGNTAALPSLIDATGRNAMKQQSDNALGISMADANLKEKQRQEGAAGVGNLYGEDVNAALKSLGLADESINAWTSGKHAANQDVLGQEKFITDLMQTGFTDATKAGAFGG